MVKPSLHAAKTKNTRVPGRGKVINKVEKTHSHPHCGVCGAKLNGVVHGPQSKVRKTSKSQRHPNRVHGGYLCPRCLKSAIKAEIRE